MSDTVGKKRAAAAGMVASDTETHDDEVAPASLDVKDIHSKRSKHDRKMQKALKSKTSVDGAEEARAVAPFTQMETEDLDDDEVNEEVKDEVKPEVEVKQEVKDEVKQEVEVKQEAKDEVKQEVEVKQEAKDEVKQEVKNEIKQEVKQESGALAGTVVLAMSPVVKKVYANVVVAAKGPPDALKMKPRPETFVLAIMCNDVEWQSKMNKERESEYTVVNFVPIKILEVGFSQTPYEKTDGANPKHLVFCDKKGKPLKDKPVKMASVSTVDNVRMLDMKTWEPHPTAQMKTKWRGAPTSTVGTISPGIPLSCNIFNENKDSIMESDTTEAHLKPLSLAIIGLVVRSREQCEKGYGINVKSIKHVPDVNIGMSGLYHDRFFYTDRSPIGDQTNVRFAVKTRVKEFDTDLFFVQKMVRGSAKVSEKPIVCVNLKGNDKKHSHTVHIQSNNKILELEMLDPESLYHEKRFRVALACNMFTILETSLVWIQFYFQWLLDANACKILIAHDEYQYNRMAEGTASASMHCALVPDEEQLFSDKNAPLNLTAAVWLDLKKRIDGPNNSIEYYAGWVLRTDVSTNKTYAILFDKTKPHVPKTKKNDATAGVPASTAEATADKDEAVAEAGEDDDDDDDDDDNNVHTSVVCRIYTGMNKARHIWRGYLLTIDNENQTVERLFPIGIKSTPPYKGASCEAAAGSENIFDTPDMVLD